MAHTLETRAKALQKLKDRRAKWLKENGPCKNGDCGSWEDLEVHHRDPTTKIDHKVWSWSEKRRSEELAKCDPWCKKCHQNKHNEERRTHGLSQYQVGCRCVVCKLAKSVEKRRYYLRKKQKAVA